MLKPTEHSETLMSLVDPRPEIVKETSLESEPNQIPTNHDEKLQKYNINKKVIIGFLSIAILVDMFGFSLILPLLPSIATDFGASAFMVGVITAANSLTALIFGPLWGKLSDKFGRKPILIINQIGTFGAFLLLATAQNVEMIILSRVIDGIFGGQFPIIRSIVSDITTPQDRTKDMGAIMGISMMGLIIGPVLGGLLGNLNWRIPSYVAAIMSIISIGVTVALLKETMPKSRRQDLQERRRQKSSRSSTKSPSIFKKEVVVRLGETFLFTMILQTFISTSSLYMNYRFGSSAAAIGWLNAEFALINVVIVTTVLPKLTKKFSNNQLLLAGVTLLAISMVIYGLASEPWILFCLFIPPFTLGASFLRPVINTNITKAVGEDQQGEVSGWSTSIQSLAEVITPLIATSFLDYSFFSIFGIHFSPYWIIALFGVLVALLLIINSLYDIKTFED